MAFTSAITYQGVEGDKRVTRGTYTSSASGTGGNIDTGLTVCEQIVFTPVGSSVATNAIKLNETLPLAGSAITIITDADEVGLWEAKGY